MAKTYASREKAIDAVEKVLFEEDGYCEKKSNASLDSKTANAGSANITKYWRDLNNWGLMGYSKGWAGGSAWSWCAALLTWVFITVFGKEAAKVLLLHLPFISCDTLGKLADKKGLLKSNPKRGDIILFWNGSRWYHTGYVYKVTDTTVYTVEGNTSSVNKVVPNGGQVCKKNYNISALKKSGHKFFRIKYAPVIKKPASTTGAAKETVSTTTVKKENTIQKKTYMTVVTKTNPLNCRAKASIKADVLGKFKKGQKVELIKVGSKTGTWTKVTGTATNGKKITGWCKSKYLKKA